MRRMWLRAVVVLVLLMTVIAGVVVIRGWVEVSRRFEANRLSADIVKRSHMVYTIGRVMEKKVLSAGAPIPESVDALRVFFENDENLCQFLREDERTHRLFSRAVLLRNVNTSDGEQYDWVILSLLPKFGRLNEDLICYTGGDMREKRRSGNIPVNDAERFFGREVVEAVYAKDRQDRVRAATQQTG